MALTPADPRSLAANITRIGTRHTYFRDFYAALMRARWAVVLGFFVAAYLVVNVVFASLYLLVGDAVANARPGSFEDAFAFSFQTLSTVGYGTLAPNPPWGNVLASFEVFVGILLAAMATGIVFAKFSRPSAGIVFSSRAAIGPRNGQPCLMIRMANARGADIVEATIRLSAIVPEVTSEGQTMRRVVDLALERSTTPLFLLTFLAIHRIDEKSPLYGLSSRAIKERGIRLLANVTAIDGTFVQTVYAYRMYLADDIVENAHFVDMIQDAGGGRFVINLANISELTRLA